MMHHRSEQRQKVVGDIRRLMSELETLLQDSAVDASEGVSDFRERMRDRLGTARETLSDRMGTARETLTDYEQEAAERARQAAYATDDYVRSHTWSAIGVAAAAGVLLGLMLNSGRR